MMKLRLPAALAVILLLTSQLGAQSGSSTASSSQAGTISSEELYLTQALEVQILRNEAQVNTLESKQLALTSIRAMIDDKRATQDNKEVIAILETLSGEGTFSLVMSNGSVINNFPTVRKDAIELLSKIGGTSARDILVKVANVDKEPIVLSQCVYGLALVATSREQDGFIVPYIAKVLARNNAKAIPDNNLAFACLLAIEKISDKFKGVGDPEIFNAIMPIAYQSEGGGGYIEVVRKQAIYLVKKLQKPRS